MIKKLQTFWFVLNHILEITDGISTRLDIHERNIRQLSTQLLIKTPITMKVNHG